MLRRVGVALLVLGLLAAGIRWLVLTLESDESKIRRAIADAAEGFDDTRVGPILDVLAREFEDETSGFRRDDLRAALAAAFFQEKDPETRGFPWRCVIDADAIEITVESGDPDRAVVAFPGRIVAARGDDPREAWSFRVEGRMEERDDGWCFVTTTHTTLKGSARLRGR